MEHVYVVWYFDDINWVIDSIYRNVEDANQRQAELRGFDTFVSVEGLN